MGRDTQGVRCMLISEEDRLVEMTVVKEGYDVLTISSLGFGKRSDIEDYRLQSRGGKGIKAGVFNDKTGTLVSLKLVKEDNDIMLIADNGIVIRTPACDISKIGRDTKGVKVMRIDGGRVVTVAVVAHQEDEKEEPVEGEESTETLAEGEVSAEAVTEEVTEATAPASDEETGDSEE
jgi:DNA gyrase subunit A